jgi:hypothetical protein
MTLVEFINKWNGRYADFDKRFGNQCKDLFSYWNDNFGYPYIYGDAKNMLANGIKSGYYTLVDSPRNGDVAVWNTPPFGHIAIYVDGYYFSQNLPEGSPCHIRAIGKTNLIGWMRPKALEGDGMTPEQWKWLTEVFYKQAGDRFNSIDAQLKVIRTEQQAQFEALKKQIAEKQCNCTCGAKQVTGTFIGEVK